MVRQAHHERSVKAHHELPVKARHEWPIKRAAHRFVSSVHPELVEACPEPVEGAGGGAPIHRGGGGGLED